MKKVAKMNKKKILYYLIIIVIAIIFNTFTQLLYYGDRLDFYWNYNFGLQISNGLLPYNDFNMVITPLLAYITGLFLKIFGKNIIIYVLLMSFLKVIIALLIAKISVMIIDQKHKNDRKNIFIISFIITNLLMFAHYYEYNYLSITFLLLIIYIECKNIDNKKNILLGILAGLSVLAKQSTGLFIILFILLKPIVFNNKDKIKCIFKRILGILIPIVIFILYLLITNSFSSFINYTIIGLLEFKNNKIIIFDTVSIFLEGNNLVGPIIFLSMLFFSVTYLLFKIYKSIKLKSKNINQKDIILFYSISAFGCFYPIMDGTHLLPSILPLLILIINSSYYQFKNISILNRSCVKKAIKIGLLLISLEIAFYPLYGYIEMYKNDNEEKTVLKNNYNSMNYVVISKTVKKDIDEVINYEKRILNDNKKVIILDSKAVIYHLPQNIYYKNYDLFMRGNFGKNGEEKLIDEIKKSKDKVYLLNKATIYNLDKKDFNQTPKEIIKYVLKNLKNTGVVGSYYIYENNS